MKTLFRFKADSAVSNIVYPHTEYLRYESSPVFFAWANRLMLTLGEPFLPEQQG